MRYLILSDMHGNQEALAAVLGAVGEERFDGYLVLGDLVGYGGSPNQVVGTIRDLPGRVVAVRGNHDKVVAGIEDGDNFNALALAAARWTAQRLTPENLAYVRDLPAGPIAVTDDLAICHGSPLDEDLYLMSGGQALDALRQPKPAVTLFGHTHIAGGFCLHGDRLTDLSATEADGFLKVDPACRYLLNPGSVGQPRDRDPRAAFMTYDTDRGIARWHRAEYPLAAAQQKILAAGLPDLLAQRLAMGF